MILLSQHAFFSVRRKLLWILLLSFVIINPSIAFCDEPNFGYDSHSKRDPFVPLVTTGSHAIVGLDGVETFKDIILEGVIYDPNAGSVAIVNGELVKENDRAGGLQVIHIKQNGVYFNLNGVEEFVPLYDDSKKN